MEPTIYKPSIYKGPTIYKTGAEGGGCGGWPKKPLGGWPYAGKFTFPQSSAGATYTTNLFVFDLDEKCFFRNYHATSTYYFDNVNCPRYYRTGGILKREDELEISIDFRITDFGTQTPGSASVILTGSTSTYNTTGSMSIDLNENSKTIVFLMANSNGWGNVDNVCSVKTDKINLDYLSNHICNVKVKHYANTDIFEIWFEGEQSEESRKTFTAPLYGGSCDHVLGGIYNHLNSISNNNGRIYFSSYVKYNGDFLPLA